MRSRLPLAALLALFAARSASASICKNGSYDILRLSLVCGDTNATGSVERCASHNAQFLTDCADDAKKAQDVIDRLRAEERPSPADLEALTAAKESLEQIRETLRYAKDTANRIEDGGNTTLVPHFWTIEHDGKGIDKLAEKALTDLAPPPPVKPDKAEIPAVLSDLAKEHPTPKAVDAADMFGAKALNAGRTDDAVKVGKALTESAPGDSRGPTLLAEAALADKNPEEAMRWAEKALKLDPNNKRAKEALGFARSELSAARLKKPVVGNLEEARGRDLNQGLGVAGPAPRGGGGPESAAKTDAPAPRPLAGLLRRGFEKMNLGDLPGALEDVSVHLDAQPKDREGRLVRAEILMRLGKPEQALKDLDLALLDAPQDARALRAKAAALYELRRDDEALAAIERALALEPASGIAHLTHAKILERKGRIPEAIAEYRAAAQLDPSLEPITEAALRRLGAIKSEPSGPAVERKLLRGGLIVLSCSLILLGLIGGAVVVTRRARTSERAAAPARERTLGKGDLIAGQYRITRELGRGGMGVVFEAVDEKLKRAVAIKQLQSDYRSSAEDAARFLQEARLVAQLRHPNVAEIYSAVEDGGLFLVFELVRGRSLDSVLGAGVTPEQARGIVSHVCAALTAAHARKIVHRDLKPSNLMLTDDGHIKVMDFGIAHQSVNGGEFTRTAVSGTPPYMSPEQSMGSVSPASDLYALGVMAYELLAGRRPFDGADLLGPKMRGEFPAVTSARAGLPAGLDAFFASALSPDPARRPRDAAAFAAAFAACWP